MRVALTSGGRCVKDAITRPEPIGLRHPRDRRGLTLIAWFRDGQPERSTSPADSATVYRPHRSSTNRFITFDPRCVIPDRPKRMSDSGHRFRNTLRSRAAIATARQSQPKLASQANRNAQAEKEPTLNHRRASLKKSMREPRNGWVDRGRAKDQPFPTTLSRPPRPTHCSPPNHDEHCSSISFICRL